MPSDDGTSQRPLAKPRVKTSVAKKTVRTPGEASVGALVKAPAKVSTRTSAKTSTVQRIILPEVGEVRILRSVRARHVSVSVLPSGEVRLTCPRHVSVDRAVDFLRSKTAWVEATRRRVSGRKAALPGDLSPEEQAARIEELRRAAREDLPRRIERLSQLTGLKYTKLSIRASRTKWGSCSGRNAISLSLFLMALPEELRDYVILHELCHTVHHDHSPRFHSLLDRLTQGRDAELHRALRQYTIRG